MKLRALNILTSLFIAACTITSCLDSDETEYEVSSNASITAFAIKDSIITYYDAVVDGKDTTLNFAVVGSEYPFVIDQFEGRIYNPDSLPKGTDVSKVVADITWDGYGVVIEAETDSIWQDTDSLNFESPVKFKVIAQTGEYGRVYTAQINVHQQEPEEMTWQKLEGNFPDIQAQKAICANGNVYVFAEQTDQVGVTMTSIADGKNWTALQNINLPAKADYASAMFWTNRFYILAGNELYASDNAIDWNKVETNQAIGRLLANTDTGNSRKLMATDTGNNYIESEDGVNWTVIEALPEGFPAAQTSFVSYALDTNSDINRTILLGLNEEKNDSVTSAWMKLDIDPSWTALECEKKNVACPKLENAALIRYDNKLYTFGGPGQRNKTFNAFEKFFQSKDNGISWVGVSESVLFPEEFEALYEEAHGQYSYIVDENHFIWIMWGETGEVWKGRTNRLGFERQ